MMEKINLRRSQLHVHSIIYYFLNTSIISDAQFDKWANELVELQAACPESQYSGYMPAVFKDWTGDTGMHLPVRDDMLSLARSLVSMYERKSNGNVPQDTDTI